MLGLPGTCTEHCCSPHQMAHSSQGTTKLLYADHVTAWCVNNLTQFGVLVLNRQKDSSLCEPPLVRCFTL